MATRDGRGCRALVEIAPEPNGSFRQEPVEGDGFRVSGVGGNFFGGQRFDPLNLKVIHQQTGQYHDHGNTTSNQVSPLFQLFIFTFVGKGQKRQCQQTDDPPGQNPEEEIVSLAGRQGARNHAHNGHKQNLHQGIHRLVSNK